ncbi:ribonucleoside-diphosphate reductase, alpha subunit [Vavraia culicis subsp. floridensis]|uniref:Ribonucleoside-diphosphate reductase n=1 Tax=Vavraia culicis (isolate floridensis) TaxID=948595 RepID=L2GVL7_VAVCU|nr:ribonucleoside-diphosphate reductase, alpha subunit [Vavraia culicis subsp. floridensis]ELA47372.1 ribonucleoside-diphosphate reductase, alpha subunit [Vavraia culicis subsp. floridensis]
MFVRNSDKILEPLDTKKIHKMLLECSHGLNIMREELDDLFNKIESGLCDNLSTCDIVSLAAECAASAMTKNPDFGCIAARIVVREHHKVTLDTFYEKVKYCYEQKRYFSREFCERVRENKDAIQAQIDYSRDYDISFFGFKTMEKSYMLSINSRTVERPQDLFMRVALGIHYDSLQDAFETYHLMSQKYFVHATPTMFNAGTLTPQLSSCFLLGIEEDSIEGIFKAVSDAAKISKTAGGLGMNVHKLRGANSLIKSTGGRACGIIPVAKIFEATLRCIDQGGKKRPGSMAIYVEPWHSDIFEFLDIRKNTGKEELRARDIFTALWIPDLFMRRVHNDENWSLFSNDDVPNLYNLYGDEFDKAYEMYEKNGMARRTVRAQKLWKAILSSQIETGTPYMCYKDSANRMNNQKHLGTIKCSNLCSEIMEYTEENEIAVCNLASLGLPRFMQDGQFDYEKLKMVTKIVVKNLNKVIDVNLYPLPETRNSNLKHRPIGLGVQGLADVFVMLRMPYDSKEARAVNLRIFETIHFAALDASCELAKEYGPYDSYEGSPMSQGVLHFDMWNVVPVTNHDWRGLRARIAKYGVRNSLLVALMPTASTSQILGYNECFEPFTTNIYTRRTLAGEFQVVNTYLMHDLMKLNLWSDEMKNILIQEEGSIQRIEGIPDEIKRLYKTAWELKMRSLIDLAADRAPYVDQSQSLNIFMAQPTYPKLTSMHFYGFKRGLKTGMYYLRTRPISAAVKFTVDRGMVSTTKLLQKSSCSPTSEDDECMSCSA